MAMTSIDLLRVATDKAYAASLTPEEIATIAGSPEWLQMVAEQRELVSSALDAHAGLTIGQTAPSPAQVAPEILNGPYKILGQMVPRVHALGIMNGQAQYTEHMSMPGTLYT